jgi:hypothetical protein
MYQSRYQMLGHNITKSLIKLFSMIILIFIVDIGYLDYVYVVILGNILHLLDVCTRRCHLAVSTANLYNLGFPLPFSVCDHSENRVVIFDKKDTTQTTNRD